MPTANPLPCKTLTRMQLFTQHHANSGCAGVWLQYNRTDNSSQPLPSGSSWNCWLKSPDSTSDNEMWITLTYMCKPREGKRVGPTYTETHHSCFKTQAYVCDIRQCEFVFNLVEGTDNPNRWFHRQSLLIEPVKYARQTALISPVIRL